MGLYGTKVLLDRGLLVQDACIVGEPSDLRSGWPSAVAPGSTPPRRARGPRLHAGPRGQRHHVDGPVRAAPRGGAPRSRAPARRASERNAAVITGGSAPNVVPDRCELLIDRRIIPGETDPAEVLAPFDRLADDISREHPEVDLTFAIDAWTEAAEAAPDTAIAGSARRAIAAETRHGRAPTSASPGSPTRASTSTTRRSPPSSWVRDRCRWRIPRTNGSLVDDLVAAARIYARIFVGFLGARAR